jgi:hypothetical protein
MRKYRQLTAIILTLLIGTLFTTGCNVVLVPADEKVEPGEMETRQYDFDEFIDVEIASTFRYEIKPAATWSINIIVGSNIFEYIEVTQAGQELHIDFDFPGGTFWTDKSFKRPEVIITMPELHSLKSSGATDGTVSGFSSDGNLDISLSGACKVDLVDIAVVTAKMDLSGASQITGSIRADSLELEVNSASKARLEGSTDYLTVKASGASRVELPDFICQNADITLQNASRGTVNLNQTLDVRVSGASTLEYIGEPVIGVLDITGASTFRKK